MGTQKQSKVTTLEQLDSAGYGGWFDVELSTGKIGTYTKGTLCVNAGSHVIEHVFMPYLQNFKMIRYWDYEYGWGEWAYDSPPMLLGEEYRTTKRHNGQPVYTKCIDLGVLPNSSSKITKTTMKSSEIQIVAQHYEAAGVGGPFVSLPSFGTDGNIEARAHLSSDNNVYINTFKDYSSMNLIATFEYVYI